MCPIDDATGHRHVTLPSVVPGRRYAVGNGDGCDVVVKVTRPDGSVVSGDGSFAPGSDTVTTDPLGNFTYDYLLPSNPASPSDPIPIPQR